MRSSNTWARASTIDWQISVPNSTTDGCISGLICSFRVTFPPPRISWLCDRSSNYHVRICVRALYGWPFPTQLRRPIRNLPDRRWLLPHPARDCKNQLQPAHRRESQTRPCSSRNRETDSASAHPARLFGEYLSVPAIRFDTANGKDAAARTALSALAVDQLNSSGNTCRTSLPPATSSPIGQSRCRRDKILPGYASDRRSSNRPLRTV